MVILGLVLLVVGALLVLGGVLGTGTESRTSDGGTDVYTTFIGIEMSATTLFIIGVVAAVLVLVGLWMTKVGARQGWRRRREQKRLTDLSEKLDRVEAERLAENDPGER
ncbi:hypothetical protein [Nocardioides sambongensis]|uniref:hypothetical protein n=1 Tax=Nocardioides sambongensis TaxID=2589074 RepID=UPI001126D8A5|nr:hypothetical protein [Nocardioides sambongensis]